LEIAKRFATQEIKLSPPAEIRRCCQAAKAAVYVESGKEYAIPFLNKMPDVDYCSVVENNL
jgi:predicted RNA-binding protein with PUA domain